MKSNVILFLFIAVLSALVAVSITAHHSFKPKMLDVKPTESYRVKFRAEKSRHAKKVVYPKEELPKVVDKGKL
jgi:hypothetical protein